MNNDVQNIIDDAMTLWYVDTNQYPYTLWIRHFNWIYHDIENTIITEVSEDFFWDYFTSDTVIWQEEYNLPTWLTWNYTSLYKSLAISVKYSNDTDYIKADRQYPYLLPQDLSHYKTNQPKSKPFYHISDKSYFIYPAPTEVVTNWIKIYWIKNLADLTISSTASDIFAWSIPTKFYNIISLWMLEFIYQARWMLWEANNARMRYLQERSKLVEYLSDRDDWVYEKQEPDLSYYK